MSLRKESFLNCIFSSSELATQLLSEVILPENMLAFSAVVPLSRAVNDLSCSGISTSSSHRQPAVTMGPWRKGEKDEAFRQQQEILARRRDKKRSDAHFEEIRKRRENIEEYYDKRRLKVNIGEDPLEAWKKLREDGLIDESQYTEMDEGGIPIPMASFGIPKYDNGGRFDLRLPHVEVGYTDPDSDIMSKAGNAFKKLFGFGSKKTSQADSAKSDENTSDTSDDSSNK